MRIDRIRIDGFGQLAGLEIPLAPKLNVIFGPNEAGKSTILSFIRAALFGFQRRADPDRHEPNRGDFGGELFLTTGAGERLGLRRTGSRRRTEGELMIRGPAGEPLDRAALTHALSGISRELFSQVFAFGLDELSSYEELAAQGLVSEALFAAGMRGARRLPEARDQLRRCCDGIFGGKTAKRDLDGVLLELRRVQDALANIGNRPAEYVRTHAQLEALDERLALVEQELEKALGARELLGKLAAVAKDVLRLAEVEAELAAFQALEAFPADGSARLDDLLERLNRSRAEADAAASEHAALRRKISASPAPHDASLDEPLRRDLDAFLSRLEQHRALARGRASLQQRQRELVEGLSAFDIDPSDLVALDLGAAARERLLALKDAVLRERGALAGALERCGNASQSRERLDLEIERLASDRDALTSQPRAAIRERQMALSKISPLREHLGCLKDAIDDREESIAGQGIPPGEPREIFPFRWLLASLAVLAAFAVGAHLATDEGRFAAVAAAFASLLLLILQRRTAALYAEGRDRSQADDLWRTNENARLREELESLRARSTETGELLREALCAAGIEADADVETAGQALERAQDDAELREQRTREIATCAADRAKAGEEQSAAEEQISLARAALGALQSDLKTFLASHGLPPDAAPERAASLWTELAALQARARDLKAENDRFAADELPCARAVEALLASARSVGIANPEPVEAAAALSALLDRWRDARQDHRRWSESLEAKSADAKRLAQTLSEIEEAIAGLLKEGGCRNEEEFRRRARQQVQYRERRSEARDLSQRIAGAGLEPEAVRPQLELSGGPAGVAAQLALVGTRYDELSKAKNELLLRTGGLRQQLEAWEDDAEIRRLRGEEENLRARASELAEKYAVNRLALALLEEARDRHERSQRPRILELASRSFAELTGGRFDKVYTLPEARRSLFVCDSRGRQWPAEQLSRGTREQLYLAFRLAVVEDFGQTRCALPVLVDDIFVNFDPARTRNAVRVLARLAEAHQMVAFTCHPQLRDLFASHGAAVLELESRGTANSTESLSLAESA